jgi:uncharacterized phage-associated protein
MDVLGVFKGRKPAIDFTGTYKAMDVAEYIVSKCSRERSQISNLQLQKILYYIQRHFLQNLRRALFSDDIEAWRYGPVVSDVYYRFSGFGVMTIYYSQLNTPPIANEDLRVIDRIVEEKRMLNPWNMVDDTHKPGKAWDMVYRGGFGNKEIIPKELIASYG